MLHGRLIWYWLGVVMMPARIVATESIDDSRWLGTHKRFGHALINSTQGKDD